MLFRKICALVALVLISSIHVAQAEPYFAVREGLKCASCHFNPAGGGMRNAFGNAWAQTALPARRIEGTGTDAWTGMLNSFVALGGNLRANATYTDVPNTKASSEFELQEMRAYLAVTAIPDRLAVYIDQRLAPGGSTNLEAFARYTTKDQHWSMQAGQFYLPYGLRLEDDDAFIRQVTGITFATPDQGVQVGYESAQWTAQLAVTNGTASGPETDEGKQASVRAEHVQSIWRVGAGFNYNHTSEGNRQMQGVFAGVRTGPIAWLAEADYLKDETLGPTERKQWVGLIEGNWLISRGQNLKLTAEVFEPDTDVDEDEQNRFSLVWEYVPFQFLQLRVGARLYDGIPQNDLQNRKIYFAQVNGFF
ncbi:porin family protein [Peristeroidobacter soli]|uniref:porin n=1 Tax=Peristeroidobacter soli TaxID=2497877 RepID=UPI00101C4B5E|nr:porin [Peristeroidobacter soli]